MKYRELKSYTTSINVSTLAIGSSMRMHRLSNDELYNIYDIFVDAGGNCVDTARAYANGKAEELIGQWLKERGNRSKIIVSTKGCHPTEDNMEKSRLSRQDMESDLNGSLKALQTDYIDIYWIHKDDLDHPVEDIVESMNSIIRSGKVRMVGCSNWSIDRIEKANKYAQESGLHGFMASQIQWSLASTQQEHFNKYKSLVMDDRSYDWYYKNQIPIFAFSSQAGGFFPRIAENGIESLGEEMSIQYVSPKNMKRLEKVIEYAKQHNVSISAPVLGYIINNKLPGVAIIGADTPEQLNQSLTACDINMNASEVDSLFNI